VRITIRRVDRRLADALERERRRRGASLNETVLGLLRQSLGIDSEWPRSNGLRKIAGGWSEADLREFEQATAVFEQIDPELWS
jgi:hypothetical protein